MRPKRFFKRFSIDLKTAFVLVILIILFFSLILILFNSFRLKNIALINVPKGIKIYGLEGYKNGNMLLLSSDKLATDVVSVNPYVAKVNVTKIYPSQLMLNFTFHKETANLQVTGGFFLLAENGRILKKLKDNNNTLTTMTYYQKLDFDNYQSGATIDQPDILKTLGFISAFDNFYSIDIQTADMIVCKLKGPRDQVVIFSLVNDQVIQIYELQTIFHELKIEGRDFKKIDLRFEKPIITY